MLQDVICYMMYDVPDPGDRSARQGDGLQGSARLWPQVQGVRPGVAAERGGHGWRQEPPQQAGQSRYQD